MEFFLAFFFLVTGEFIWVLKISIPVSKLGENMGQTGIYCNMNSWDMKSSRRGKTDMAIVVGIGSLEVGLCFESGEK